MDLELSTDQADLLSAVREFLAAKRPVSALREHRTAEDVDRLWRETCALGWLAISLTEADGGLGNAFVDEALVFEELGRYLAPGPFLPTTLGVRLAALAGDHELIGALTDGSSWVGLAVPCEPARLEGDRVSGRFLVADGEGAGHLLIWTRAGTAILAAKPDALQPLPSLDETTPLAELILNEESARLVADGAQGQDLGIRAKVLSAALLAGIAAATRDMSVEFAKNRTQFGKPIGTFQAVSRRCADMAIRAWSASSLMRVAALCVDDGRNDAAYQAAAAKAFAGEAAQTNATDNIQNHGAIGWTAEHEAHHFLKRARLLDTLWGDIRQQVPILVDEHPPSIGLGAEVPEPAATVGHDSERTN